MENGKFPYLRFITGSRGFNEVKEETEGVSAKMLSKERRELELNELISRKVQDAKPITVQYSIAGYYNVEQLILPKSLLYEVFLTLVVLTKWVM